MNFEKYLDIALSLRDKPNARNKHFSIIVKKNRIVSIGWNDAQCSHPLSKKYGYYDCKIHSELAAIIKLPYSIQELHRCILINIRLGKNNQPAMSRPCKNCLKLLDIFRFKRVYYTGESGKFLEL